MKQSMWSCSSGVVLSDCGTSVPGFDSQSWMYMEDSLLYFVHSKFDQFHQQLQYVDETGQTLTEQRVFHVHPRPGKYIYAYI